MKKAFIVSALRTPIGKFGGCFRNVPPLELLIKVVEESLGRVNLKGENLDLSIFGNVLDISDQNIARTGPLLMGYPEWRKFPYSVPGFTIDCACTSSAQAIMLGANAIKLGQASVVLAGGMESMSQVPYILKNIRWGQRIRHEVALDMLWHTLQEHPVGGGMGLAAERVAELYKISREEQDELALSSHQRAVRAIKENKFEKEIVPFEVKSEKGDTNLVTVDEGPREDTSMESLRKLPPVFKEGGVITAGNASQMSDAAAAVILMSEEKAKEYGLEPLGEVKSCSFVAVDPLLIGTSPVPAIKYILDEAKLKLNDIQIFEINEAFASYYIAVERELGLNREITNVNGSGISLGHPVGATGTRMVVTLLYEMERRGLNLGVSAMCGGGGLGTAILIER